MRKNLFTRTISLLLSLAILLGSSHAVWAATLPYMPEPGSLFLPNKVANISCAMGMKFDPRDPLKLTFIMDKGTGVLSERMLKEEGANIARYFLSALAIPESELWVNLSPYEKNRIIDNDLARTDLGRDMLGTDYLLKQLAASLTHPDTPQGRKYWEEIQISNLKFPISNTLANEQGSFAKVWIVPGRIHLYEEQGKVFVDRAPLKVLCEQDYLAEQKNNVWAVPRGRPNNGQAQRPAPTQNIESFKKNILPLIEQEVNHGASFARLRQFYRAIILASWFKAKLKESFLNSNYFNQHKVKGVDTTDSKVREQIYQDYLTAFQKGAYNYVKSQRAFNMVAKRQYFSGGEALNPDLEHNSDTQQGVPANMENGAAQVDVVCDPVSEDEQDKDEIRQKSNADIIAMMHRENPQMRDFVLAIKDFLYPGQTLSDSMVAGISGIARGIRDELIMGYTPDQLAQKASGLLPSLQADGTLLRMSHLFDEAAFSELLKEWQNKFEGNSVPRPSAGALDAFLNRNDEAEVAAFASDLSQAFYGEDISAKNVALSGLAMAVKDRLAQGLSGEDMYAQVAGIMREFVLANIIPPLPDVVDAGRVKAVLKEWQKKVTRPEEINLHEQSAIEQSVRGKRSQFQNYLGSNMELDNAQIIEAAVAFRQTGWLREKDLTRLTVYLADRFDRMNVLFTPPENNYEFYRHDEYYHLPVYVDAYDRIHMSPLFLARNAATYEECEKLAVMLIEELLSDDPFAHASEDLRYAFDEAIRHDQRKYDATYLCGHCSRRHFDVEKEMEFLDRNMDGDNPMGDILPLLAGMRSASDLRQINSLVNISYQVYDDPNIRQAIDDIVCGFTEEIFSQGFRRPASISEQDFFDNFTIAIDPEVLQPMQMFLNPNEALHRYVRSLAEDLAAMIVLPQAGGHEALITFSAAVLAYMLTFNDVREGAKRLAIIMQKMQERNIGNSRNIRAEDIQELAQKYFSFIKENKNSSSLVVEPVVATIDEVVERHLLKTQESTDLQISFNTLMWATKKFLQEQGVTGDLDNAALEIATLTYHGNVGQAIIEASQIGVDAQIMYRFIMPYAQGLVEKQNRSSRDRDRSLSCGTMTAAGEKDLRPQMRRVYESMRQKLIALGLRSEFDTTALSEKNVTKAAAALGLTGTLSEGELNEILDVIHEDTILNLGEGQLFFTPAPQNKNLYYAEEMTEVLGKTVTHSAAHFSMRDGERIHIPPKFLEQFPNQQMRIDAVRELVKHELGHMAGKTHADAGMDYVARLGRYIDTAIACDQASLNGGLNFSSVLNSAYISSRQDSADIDLKKIIGMRFRITGVSLPR